MFEYETTLVKNGVAFLSALTEKDYRQDPSFDPDDLRKRLKEIQSDIDTLSAALPYEAVDDSVEREREFPGEFEDSAELEDEIVECEKLMEEALKEMKTVREMYLPKDELLIRSRQDEGNATVRTGRGSFLDHYVKSAKEPEYLPRWAYYALIVFLVGLIVWWWCK